MEQTRFLLAIVLSFLVLVLWNAFFVDHEIVQKPEEKSQSSEVTQETPYVKESETPFTDTKPTASESELSQPVREPKIITVHAPLYSVRISEKGAAFKSFILKDYREKVGADSPLKEMIPENIPDGTIQTLFTDNSLPGLKDAFFASNIDSDTFDVTNHPQELIFSWVSKEGIVIEKRFLFNPSTYLIGMAITVKNGSERTLNDHLAVSLFNKSPGNKKGYVFEGPSALINNKVEQIDIDDIEDKNIYTGDLKWIGIESRYFISGLILKEPVASSTRLSINNNILSNQYLFPKTEIQPGTQHQFRCDLFLGPKSLNILKGLNNDLDKAINFGWFDFIAKPCLWLLNFLYSFIPNYGLAIIILTLFVKLILWPLGNKGYKSMNEMKKLQPLMTEIREKYKNDKQKLNQEVMRLYKTYNVNPLGGCLPLLLQIPVFFALYRMLYEAIELRHAPFIWWIDDLAAPDRLFRFNFSIPFMEPPYGIPVLTIIMGATMFLQQKMSPPPADPTQAKMMMIVMPIVMTFIFINFSSGLVLYWLISNVLSVAQQYYISKKNA